MKIDSIDSSLRKLIQQGGLQNLFFADFSYGKLPENASVNASPRLLIALKGRARYGIGSHNGMRMVKLQTGEALFIPSGGWVKTLPQSYYRSMGIVFNRDDVRHYITRGTRTAGKWVMQIVSTGEYRKPLDPISGDCLRILSEASGQLTRPLQQLSVANLLLCECEGLPELDNKANSGIAWQHWQTARHFIEENLQEPLQRSDIADYMQLHPNHVSRLFKAYSGIPLNQFIREARLNRAELLLANPKLNISEVAHLCGFTSSNYFIRIYKSRHGHPPGQKRGTR